MRRNIAVKRSLVSVFPLARPHAAAWNSGALRPLHWGKTTEVAMSRMVCALTTALALGTAAAMAQDKSGPVPTTGGPETQKAQGAPDSPPQHQVIGPPNAGPVAVRGDASPLGSSTQTIPSTLSQENAARDAHWWLDRGLALSDEQKRKIYGQLARDGAQKGPGTTIFAEPSVELPLGTRFYEIPAELSAEVPYIKSFKYLVDQNKVVLVDSVNGVVAAVIEQ
jgi:hypothetical protein